MKNKNLREERRIVSVRCNGEDKFFGSISAIYEYFSPQDLGISYNQLRYFFCEKNDVFSNTNCRIVRGRLESKRKQIK